jgi:hypothetical protein
MYARVMSAKVEPGQVEALLRALRESVVPCASEQRGYQGAFGLLDHSSSRGMLVTLWDSASDLEMTERGGCLGSQLAEVSAFLDGPAISETFEVVIEELPAHSNERRPIVPDVGPTPTELIDDA